MERITLTLSGVPDLAAAFTAAREAMEASGVTLFGFSYVPEARSLTVTLGAEKTSAIFHAQSYMYDSLQGEHVTDDDYPAPPDA